MNEEAAIGIHAAEVRLDGVTKAYAGQVVLPELSVRVAGGELVTLLGPSGCGKSTTLKIIAGFERADGGAVRIGGKDVTRVPAYRRGIGMVFQGYSLFPHLTVAGNISYGMRVHGMPTARRRERVRDLLEMCGMGGFEGRYPHELSGGQQQRIALARALATEPAVLLLDEPLSALDASVRRSLRTEIRSLQQRLGMTMVFVTHDQEEALEISDRIAVMDSGRIAQIASPSEIYERPASPAVARFIGTVNEFDVDRGWQAGAVSPGAQGEERIFVRPEHVRLAPGDGAEATVTARTYMGDRTRVQASAAGKTITATLRNEDAAALHPGVPVRVSVAGPVALRLPREDA